MLQFQADLTRKPAILTAPVCRVEKIIELERDEFVTLTHCPNTGFSFIAENRDLTGEWDGEFHCLLALDKDGDDGVLINAEGYDSVRYGAFVSKARAFVEWDMKQTADYLLADISHDGKTDDNANQELSIALNSKHPAATRA